MLKQTTIKQMVGKKRFKIVFILILLQLLYCTPKIMKPGGSTYKNISVIPEPISITQVKGHFIINQNTQILFHNSILKDLAIYLKKELQQFNKLPLSSPKLAATHIHTNTVLLTMDTSKKTLGTEGYELTISKTNITLSAYKQAGLFYAIQTIRQLLFESIKTKGKRNTIPCVNIIDKPQFQWRGLMLDVSRHFMSKDFIKRYIDLIALYKLNTLHLHLTDDQGWRIEIKKYPKLTQIGSTRKQKDGSIHKGYYTQKDIKEIVIHAKNRFITIIPEIEFPCHSTAALASYPELSCTGGPFTIKQKWGIFKEAYCVGNKNSYTFMNDVLNEVIQLFPSKHIHIGGDECKTSRWEECDKCNRLMKEKKYTDHMQLQDHFINTIEAFLNSKKRNMIGWEETVRSSLQKRTIIQVWKNKDKVLEALQKGHNVIVSLNSHVYFDHYLAKTDLKQVYSFDPIPKSISKNLKANILGSEAAMWTERSPEHLVDSKVFPRLLAFSEILWTYPKKRNFKDFHMRVQFNYNILKSQHVTYGAETEPWINKFKHWWNFLWE